MLIDNKGLGLRVVLGPRNLNKYLKRPNCQIPTTAEDISSKLTNSKLFSVLDASSAFWMLKLDKKNQVSYKVPLIHLLQGTGFYACPMASVQL